MTRMSLEVLSHDIFFESLYLLSKVPNIRIEDGALRPSQTQAGCQNNWDRRSRGPSLVGNVGCEHQVRYCGINRNGHSLGLVKNKAFSIKVQEAELSWGSKLTVGNMGDSSSLVESLIPLSSMPQRRSWG